MQENEYFPLLESLLFASDGPLTLKQLEGLIPDWPIDTLDSLVQTFLNAYNNQPGGMMIVRVAGGWQLVTRPEYADAIRKMKTLKRRFRFSRAALETLAIVAYQQPVTSPEIEDIRGVDSSGVLKTLLEKKLVTLLGRKKGPGNPLLYGTTDQFLIAFGLDSLEALPSLKEYEKLIPRGATNLEIPFEVDTKEEKTNIPDGDL